MERGNCTSKNGEEVVMRRGSVMVAVGVLAVAGSRTALAAETDVAPPAEAPEGLPSVATPSAEAPKPQAQPATTAQNAKEGASLGFDLVRLQDDFGFGLDATSPALVHWIRFRLAGGVAWYPHATEEVNGVVSNSRWAPIYHGRLLVEAGPSFSGEQVIRPYAFGGPVVIAASGLTGNEGHAVEFGGVGGFGLEARFRSRDREGPVTYFFELGGIGSSAKTEMTHDTIASGFFLSAGFRAYP
jgi:hypothetical protein